MSRMSASPDGAPITSRILGGDEARNLVAAHGIAVPPWRLVRGLDAALSAAAALGYPVALKSAASEIPHKSEVGCVRIGIASPDALRKAYDEVTANARTAGSMTPESIVIEQMVDGGIETVIGLKRSETFGPVLLVGMGGIWVEQMRDYVLRLCPVNPDEALEMLRELRGFPMLAGGRGRPPCDLNALIKMIVAVSQLGKIRDDLIELDLNPVMVMEQSHGAISVDARAVLVDKESG